jgi:putative ABC transport system substrate-binding protein
MIARRSVLLGLGSAALLRFSARAQQPRRSVIGFLHPGTPELYESALSFRRGLQEAGYLEGRNVTLDFAWGDGQYDRLDALAAELVNREVTVIFAASLPAALAAKKATSTVPIVFVMGADPVALGLVKSLSRPGGNITGVTQYHGALGGKRLELLRDLVPGAATIAVLSNPQNPNAEPHLRDIADAARALGQPIEIFRAADERTLDEVFPKAKAAGGALLVVDDPFFRLQRHLLVELAAGHRLPASYFGRDFVAAGGLMAYGSDSEDNTFRAAIYVGRILGGANPAELPVLQPTKFELIINLRTARALDLTVPSRLLARADEVIE